MQNVVEHDPLDWNTCDCLECREDRAPLAVGRIFLLAAAAVAILAAVIVVIVKVLWA